MKWQKLGCAIDPQGAAPWMASHAALPFAVALDGERYRIFCAGRDGEGRGQIGCVDLSLENPQDSAVVHPQPVLRVGALGCFDDRGVLSSCLVQEDDRTFLYFTGVVLGQTVPFYYTVGLAIGSAHAFERYSAAPILERNRVDPYLTASPYVLREADLWRMWYVSGQRWTIEDGRPKHYYHIRYAESADGLNWRREGKVCIDFRSGEYAIGRPSVLKSGALYRMWYCYRGERYRIGYAESADGISWERKDDEAGIDVSPDGWDSEMICYPHVFEHGGTLYMVYNGNGYGKTGFGLAKAMP